MAPTMVSQPAQGSMGMGKRRVTLDSWECQLPNLRPVCTRGRSLMVPGSSCTTQQSASRTKSSLTLDLSLMSDRAEEEEKEDGDVFNVEESDCETPKATEHRIPDVDIDFCPPAPKKPRSMGRFALVCAIQCDKPEFVSNPSLKMQASPCYLF
ncbi:uncharacterized protein [Physcomitrium patens]|uniref:Uncharacterized protein n=2 Tax=Physcomitrium patens TaxID=3218 RepID=A0A2K1K8M9_PHYPA|nr:uncharacterized protein LOC112285329 [Physcomitrium patens]PNR50127.1 hypothetical protein PHYPA_012024 [Physcomitrium patens]|eukprot:XP_024381809.1 uncharacterized protein LOC112285329 [Physcomitrella patens]